MPHGQTATQCMTFDVSKCLSCSTSLKLSSGRNRGFSIRADYIDDSLERRCLCNKALQLARAQNDQDEIEVVLQSSRDLEEDLLAEAKHNSENPKHNRVPGSN
jgi:hypothetical protein